MNDKVFETLGEEGKEKLQLSTGGTRTREGDVRISPVSRPA